MLDICSNLNGYCPVRRASSVFDSVFFSSLFLFSGFSPIPPKPSNHGFKPAWGSSHLFIVFFFFFFFFFFLSKHVQHPVYPIAALAALSLSLSLSPRSASEFHPSIVDFENTTEYYHCIAFTPMMQSIHSLSIYYSSY